MTAAPTYRDRDFVGSAWALDRVQDWLAGKDPVLVISGQPGAGKTAVVQRLVALSTGAITGPLSAGTLHAWHYCRHADTASTDAVRVIQKLSNQLASSVAS